MKSIEMGADAIEGLLIEDGPGDARPTKADLILLDLNMPKKDGRETVAESRRGFLKVGQSIDDFWLSVVQLPGDVRR